MISTIFLILGFPGVGKYTTAIELVRLLSEQGNAVKLLDNHRIANIFFDLIAEADGATPLPKEIFPKIREMNMAVLHTIKELSPASWSFVFTHYLSDTSVNKNYVDSFRQLARHRKSIFAPVVLSADHDELLRRITAQDRRAKQKLVDPAIARTIIESNDLFVPSDALHIDVTKNSPSETARRIIHHAQNGAFIPT